MSLEALTLARSDLRRAMDECTLTKEPAYKESLLFSLQRLSITLPRGELALVERLSYLCRLVALRDRKYQELIKDLAAE